MKDSIALTKSFTFSVEVVKLAARLKGLHQYSIADQLLRSATSIAANIEEARAASSRRDFIYKMSIASKEARESLYWIRLIEASELLDDISYMQDSASELVKILSAIVITAQKNDQK